MQINSELPLCMMHRNIHLNEYDFVLYHLLLVNDQYRAYYQNLRHSNPDRWMILDNSAYEFFITGQKLNIEDFMECVGKLRPDMFILPDVLMDKDATIAGTKRALELWKSKYEPNIIGNKPEPLAVVQGISIIDFIKCMLEYRDLGIKNIAIPFHNSFFKDAGYSDDAVQKIFTNTFGKYTDDMAYAVGRIKIVNYLDPMLYMFDHVHLLGSHNPMEKAFYTHPNIKTMDTGYPVKCAIAGYELFKEPSKPNIIIDEFLDEELTNFQMALIDTNVCKFRAL